MKASSPRVAILVTLVGLWATLLTGCGVASKNFALTQGNWSVLATSTKSATAFTVGGNLTQSGNSVSGTMYVTGAVACNIDSSQAVKITGTVNGKQVALTSASIAGQVITIAASGTTSALTGTYVITGGLCDGDQGTIAANAVPSITGTWSGTVLVNTAKVTMSVALTQAATASQDGTFALTGTVNYVGSSCPATATLLPSAIKGGSLAINTDTGVNYVASLDSTTAPKNMAGDYDSTSDPCAGSDGIQPVTLTKQ